jgi:hypothetical protein
MYVAASFSEITSSLLSMDPGRAIGLDDLRPPVIDVVSQCDCLMQRPLCHKNSLNVTAVHGLSNLHYVRTTVDAALFYIQSTAAKP